VPHLRSFTVPDSAAARAAARVATVGRSSSSAPSRTRRSDENTFGGGRSDTPLPPSAATEVKDGALDILEALGVCVALGIAELGRRVLYNIDVSPHLFLVHLLEVIRDGEVFPLGANFRTERPFVAIRQIRDAAGCYSVWSRDALRPLQLSLVLKS